MYQEANLAQQWVWGIVQTIHILPEMLQWHISSKTNTTRIIILTIYYTIMFCLPEELRAEPTSHSFKA